MSYKSEAARRRNWCKFLLGGMLGQLRYVLSNERIVLTEHEKKKFEDIEERLCSLQRSWKSNNDKAINEAAEKMEQLRGIEEELAGHGMEMQ